MTMQEKQRGQQEMNALRRLDPSSATYLQDVKQINPKMGFEFEKMQRDAKNADTEGQIKNLKLLTDRLALLPEAYRRADTPEAYLTLHQSIHADPVVGPWLKSTGATLERGLATIQTAVDTGKFNELRADSMQSVAQILDSMKPQPDAALMKQLGYAQTPEGFRAFQEAKRAPAPAEKKVTSLAEFEAFQNMTPAEKAAFMQMKRSGQPSTNVQLPPQEKAEQAKRGEMLVSEYSDLSKAAKLAVRTIPSIDANLNILSSGFETGFGTETVAAGASVLAAFGVQNAEKFATNSQIFRAKASEAVLQKQLEQKGTQTKSDSDRIEEIGAQLGKTTAGNKFVLTTAREQLKRDIEQRNFYDSWWKSNKTYDGAESAWYAGEGNKSLFDRPALKQYAAAQIPGQNAAVNMPEQNTTNISVTLPDGRVKTFPNAEAANQFKKAAGIK